MKTVITIEDGKVTVAVDDTPPVTVRQHLDINLAEASERHEDERYAKAAKEDVVINAPAGKSKTKYCERPGCHNVFVPKTVKSKFCSDKCAAKVYTQRMADKKRANVVAEVAKPTEGVAFYCARCKAYTGHKTKDHVMATAEVPVPPKQSVEPKPLIDEPDFMPGYEKTPAELEAIRKANEPVPVAPPPRTKSRSFPRPLGMRHVS